jgi:3'-5' exoribonuclease
VWDNVDTIAGVVQAGDFVEITAAASEYRGVLQLVVKSMAPLPADAVIPADYLPATTRDVDQMVIRLRALTDTISSGPLKRLMTVFWNDEDLVRKLKKAPAAKHMHHAYIGGLLEHTLSMGILADRIAGHYGGVNRDILIVGVVLHDIGKVRELSFDHRIDYTDEGRLLSHIVLGLEILEEKLQKVEDFPAALASLLKHMIVSHHGARDFGSPEPPKTIEAVLLNYIDEIDSRVKGIREFMAQEDKGSAWTSYHRLLERHFYKGGPDDAQELSSGDFE